MTSWWECWFEIAYSYCSVIQVLWLRINRRLEGYLSVQKLCVVHDALLQMTNLALIIVLYSISVQ